MVALAAPRSRRRSFSDGPTGSSGSVFAFVDAPEGYEIEVIQRRPYTEAEELGHEAAHSHPHGSVRLVKRWWAKPWLGASVSILREDDFHPSNVAKCAWPSSR